MVLEERVHHWGVVVGRSVVMGWGSREVASLAESKKQRE